MEEEAEENCAQTRANEQTFTVWKKFKSWESESPKQWDLALTFCSIRR